jgi:hypothetical protein
VGELKNEDRKRVKTPGNKLYSLRLRRHIRRELSHEALDFCTLVRRAGGAFPIDVQETLKSLIGTGEAHEVGGRYTTRTSGQLPVEARRDSRRISTGDSGGGLPQTESDVLFSDPHPADYDWRCTSRTLNDVTRRLRSFVENHGQIALLGAPTLYPELARLRVHVTLFDKSPSLLRDLRAAGFHDGLVEQDLFAPIRPAIRDFDVVFADPPWYPPFYRAFVLRSAELLKDEGRLLLSVLPWLTRPSAIDDRREVLSFAADSGFDLEEVVPGELTYQSPGFEKAVLEPRGIDCGEWRSGDLCVFRRVNDPKPGLYAERPKDEPDWYEYQFGARKVKLRRRPGDQDPPFAVRELANGSPVLSSVSRRSPLRALIDVWTSDNVAYAVEGLEILREALERVENCEPVGSVAQAVAAKYGLSDRELRTLTTILTQMVDANKAPAGAVL